MKIAILAGRSPDKPGWLASVIGSFLKKQLKCETQMWFGNFSGMDLVNSLRKSFQPDVVINAVGYSGEKSISDCENDRKRTEDSNLQVVYNLRDSCLSGDTVIIQLSTANVFDRLSQAEGEAWLEDDKTGTKSVYGESKRWAENALYDMWSHQFVIIRIHQPIGKHLHQRNLIHRLGNFRIVSSEKNSFTYVDDLAKNIYQIALNRLSGVFHLVNGPPISLAEMVPLYQKYVDEKFQPRILTREDILAENLSIRTPIILSSQRADKFGLKMGKIDDVLIDVMSAYACEVNGAFVESKV